MTTRTITATAFLALLISMPIAVAAQTDTKPAEDASAVSQYKNLNLTRDPKAAAAGEYKLDPHHTSVTAKLAHMDLSRYTLRLDSVSGGFTFDPSQATASALKISIDPKSVSTGDPVFDKRIAQRYFEADKFATITFTSASVKVSGEHVVVDGVLDFHGVRKPVTLKVIYRGFAQSRMGFSGEASFKRSDFGVGEWIPLEGDEVSILIEAEFVKS
jgi:polyisoprenoid-binding protein YceI